MRFSEVWVLALSNLLKANIQITFTMCVLVYLSLRFLDTSLLSRMLWLLVYQRSLRPRTAACIYVSLMFFWGRLFSEFPAIIFVLHSWQTCRAYREYFPEMKHEEVSDLVRCKEHNIVFFRGQPFSSFKSSVVNWALTMCSSLGSQQNCLLIAHIRVGKLMLFSSKCWSKLAEFWSFRRLGVYLLNNVSGAIRTQAKLISVVGYNSH